MAERHLWSTAIDQWTALHGVFGGLVGAGLSQVDTSQTKRITTLALINIGFEIIEQKYFMLLNEADPTEPQTIELGVNSATDIAIGFLSGLSMLYALKK